MFWLCSIDCSFMECSESSHQPNLCSVHRIINDKIEKYKSYIVFSQSRIAAMNNEESTALAYPPTTPIPHARPPGLGNGGGWRVRQGNTSPANITILVEMQY